MKKYVGPILGVLLVVGMVLVYKIPAVAELVQLERMLAGAEKLRQSHVAALLVPLVFVGLCLILVPVTVLRTTTVIAFGPILGPIYALTGSIAAAYVGHELGRRAGHGKLQAMAGPRVQKIKELIDKRGVWAVAAMRLVPLGPFTVVNVACGAAGIRRGHFLVGSLLVMIPGVVVLAVLVHVFDVIA